VVFFAAGLLCGGVVFSASQRLVCSAAGVLGGWCSLRLVFFAAGVLSGWFSRRVVFFAAGLLCGWCAQRLVFSAGGFLGGGWFSSTRWAVLIDTVKKSEHLFCRLRLCQQL
jgi:hypothetical protein